MDELKYWRECISCALDEMGVVLTEGQVNLLASAVESAHSNYGMAFGYDCIPDPHDTAREEAARRHKEEMKKAELREELLKKNIAARYNCDVWVSIKDGQVEVERKR